MQLLVHNIQRFCLHDGPGIRTTAFLQGCTLRCWWCHNPDTQAAGSPTARAWSIDELVKELERDARFWRSGGGGVTLSGGEPLAQASAAAALLAELGQRDHHRAVETAGGVPLIGVQQVAPHVDLWLWDLKSLDADRFREVTGGRLATVLDNLAWVLRETDTPVRVRVPLIPGVNTDASDLTALADYLDAQPRRARVELLPGHDTGRRLADVAVRSARLAAEPLQHARRLLAQRHLLLQDSSS